MTLTHPAFEVMPWVSGLGLAFLLRCPVEPGGCYLSQPDELSAQLATPVFLVVEGLLLKLNTVLFERAPLREN